MCKCFEHFTISFVAHNDSNLIVPCWLTLKAFLQTFIRIDKANFIKTYLLKTTYTFSVNYRKTIVLFLGLHSIGFCFVFGLFICKVYFIIQYLYYYCVFINKL